MHTDFTQSLPNWYSVTSIRGLAKRDFVEGLLEVGEGVAQEAAWGEGPIYYVPL